MASFIHRFLSGMQTCFFEAKETNTFHTRRIKSGDIRGAKLLRLKCVQAANDFVYYYAWVNPKDNAASIGDEWCEILWGKMVPTELVWLDHPMFFTHNGALLRWLPKLENVKMGDTIVHNLN
jgi:hypothetical protein